MKVMVLHSDPAEGAGADELDAVIQAEAVSRALRDLGWETAVMPFPVDVRKTIEVLSADPPSLVFNLVETVRGDGRLIHVAPSLLDHLRIPYTGASAEALFLTSNKLLAKKTLRAAGLRTPAWIESPRTIGKLPRAGISLWTAGRYIVKSVWEHASVGLDESSVMSVEDPARLIEEMDKRRESLGGDCFAERYIDGREFNVSLLGGDYGPEVLPPAEIRFDAYPANKIRVVDYRAKWEPQSFEYLHTVRRFDFDPEEESLLASLSDMATACWRLFELNGYARVDFRVDEAGVPWILEVNANPCLAPDAGFAAAAERAGIAFDDVVRRIVRDCRA